MNHSTAATPNLSQLMASPNLYPFKADWLQRNIYLLQADPQFYHNTPFLNQQGIKQGMRGFWAPMDTIRQETDKTQQEKALHYIFHIGHCGSTLLSRALALSGKSFPVREPLPLRDIAHMWSERDKPWSMYSEAELLKIIDLLHKLWARTTNAGETAAVKATSFCSQLAQPLLERYPVDKAIMLAVSPKTYLANMLLTPDYIMDLKPAIKPRMISLMKSADAELPPMTSMSRGELIALCYMSDLVNLDMAAQLKDGQCIRLDFDHYLKHTQEQFIALNKHFQTDLNEQTASDILQNPILHRYSKATEYTFSQQARLDRLSESLVANNVAVTAGLNWMSEFCAKHTVGATALGNFSYGLH